MARIAEDARDLTTCGHCNRPLSDCTDSERVWFPQRSVCFASMESAAANARYDAKHEARPYHDGTFQSWAKERSPHHPYHARDGVSIWVHDVDLAPDDDFLTDGEAVPRGNTS